MQAGAGVPHPDAPWRRDAHALEHVHHSVQRELTALLYMDHYSSYPILQSKCVSIDIVTNDVQYTYSCNWSVS